MENEEKAKLQLLMEKMDKNLIPLIRVFSLLCLSLPLLALEQIDIRLFEFM